MPLSIINKTTNIITSVCPIADCGATIDVYLDELNNILKVKITKEERTIEYHFRDPQASVIVECVCNNILEIKWIV